MRSKSAWIWWCAVVVSACAPAASGPGREPSVSSAASTPSSSTGTTTLEALPWDERVGLERAMAESDPRHAPTIEGGAPQLASGAVTASFGDSAELHVGEHTATLRAVSLSRGTTRTKLAAVPATIDGAEVRAERAPGIVEWWRSLASGLEHGVTIAERPSGEGELTLEIAVSGLGVRSVSDDAVAFTAPSGEVVATYAHLMVTDATGARLPARMVATADRIELAVDDADANYPLVIDPLVVTEEADLLRAGFPSANFGHSVSLSADGSRALVGMPGDDAAGLDAGSARVFLRIGAAWAEEASLSPNVAAGAAFGTAVALSGDGTRAIVGAPLDDTAAGEDSGSARVYSRSGITWTEEAVLVALDGAMSDQLGSSVAMSADGSRAVVGAPLDDTVSGSDAGTARVFARTGTTWAEEVTLLASDGAPLDLLGISVAIAGDGTRTLIGTQGDDTAGGVNAGSTRVFVRSGTTWSEEATLLASDGAASDAFGCAVSLSTDGSRALVGVRYDNANRGSARVFARTATTWTEEATLVGADSVAGDTLGWSVALSGDGTRAIVGAPDDDAPGGFNAGTARVFLRSGATWSEETSLTAPDGATTDAFGYSVAMSSDGSRSLVGVRWDDAPITDVGSVRVFLRTTTTWAQQATLAPSDGTSAGDNFGISVALSADGARAIVGAAYDDTARGVDAGSARVFARAGVRWYLESFLTASDGAPADLFGSAVAIDGDGGRVLVGAYFDDTSAGVDAGSARVFVRTGTDWAEEQTLSPSSPAPGDYFGWSVGLSRDGTRALVGARADDTAGGPDAGSATVFVRSGTAWTEEMQLIASDGGAADRLATSAAISADGTRAVLGAIADDTTRGVDVGSARVFVRSGATWMEEATLTAPMATPGDLLGTSVALSNDGSRALVGAYAFHSTLGVREGFALVFVRSGSTWTREATLTGMGTLSGDEFGFSVGLSGDGTRAVIGARLEDTVGTDAGSARLYVRAGSAWTEQTTLLLAGAASDHFGFASAISEDGSRVIVGGPFFDTPSAPNGGSARVYRLRATPGTACSNASACLSGFCVDGVCCDSACGDGALDCQACSVGAGAAVDGVCGALRPDASPVTCRPGTDACDRPERCVAGSTTCPPDELEPMGHECRGSLGGCDPAETCDGASAACPVDVIGALDSICRPAAGLCDRLERCDGVSTACPPDEFVPASTVCRASVGGCDVAEVCDGATAPCPGDDVLPAGSVCGVGMGTCAMPSVCDGSSFLCNAPGGVRPAGTVCRTPAGECDVEDVCDGTSEMCRDVFQPATTTCGGTPSGVCDAQDHCTGTSADCMPTFLDGVECRASSGGCDPAELCTGSAECPPNQLSPAGTVCRASSTACDLAESCDGVATTCPADMSTCEGGVPDSGGAIDAGTTPPPVEACRCVIAPRARPPVFGLLGLALAWLIVLARRR